MRNSHCGTLYINVPGGAARTCISQHLQPANSTSQATLTASPTLLAKISDPGVRLGPQPPLACLTGTEHRFVTGPPEITSTQELLLKPPVRLIDLEKYSNTLFFFFPLI